MRIKLSAFFLTLLITSGSSFAQSKSGLFALDSTYLPAAYYENLKTDLPIYNGRLFESYPPTVIGTPFLDDAKWHNGAVCFDSIWYKNLSLRYDANDGSLLIEDKQLMPVIMPRQKLSAFYLEHRKFVKLDPSVDKTLTDGFYEVLNETKLPVLILRKKYIRETIDQQQSKIDREFVWISKFYIYKDKRFQPVQSQKDLYTILGMRRSVVAKALRKAHIKFKTNAEDAILTAAQLYNQ
ncbi:MAG: hypothetical protein J7539_00210 [Niabella sp.]|nr:hypothetical protein [Niabella sp.]